MKIRNLFILFLCFLSINPLSGETHIKTYNILDTLLPSDSLKDLIKIFPVHDSIEGINAFYGLQFYKDGIITMIHAKRKFNTLKDYVSFGDFDTYYVPLKDFQPGKPVFFSGKKAFPYPPGALSFSKDEHTLYFSRPVRNRSGSIIYKIFRAVKNNTNGEWVPSPEPLSFCNDNFSYLHPALSADGKTLIFASDLPGSRGGFDLFSSVLKKSGWSDPTNLGPTINSGADELFPYLDDYNNLYFSSNRDSIPNGFDIYVARFNGKGWDKPFKLGTEINTLDDELMFKIRPDDTLALLVSFSDSGTSRLHFYRLSISDSMKVPAVKIAMAPKPETTQKESTVKTPQVVVPVAAPKPKPKPEPPKKPSDVVFKVQIVASMVPSGSYTVWINHKKYYTWEYFYQGAYRYTIGEFDNVEDALQLKALCRKEGYPQAFVAAFRKNKRVLDPAVFKH